MNENKRFFMCAVSFVLVAFSAFAVDDELVSRYLNAANDQLSAGNNAKAFSYVNIVLNSYKAETVPQNVEVIAETIYYSYLVQIRDARSYKDFSEVKAKLIEFPFLSSERITRLVKVINTYETQNTSWGGDPAQSARAAPQSGLSLERQLALESVKKDAVDQTQKTNDDYQKRLLSTQKEAYETALRQANEANGVSGRVIAITVILVAGICFIVFIIVIINLVVNMRNTKNQNEKFVETLKAVSELARIPQSSRVDALPNLYGNAPNVRLLGTTLKDTGLPPPPANEVDQEELNNLAATCRDFGLQIDQATGRKNNSKNVAELVFKISQEMGMMQYESMLFFSVSMVYDIGFLSIDRSLLLADNLTEDQKYEIRNHVKQGLAQLSFVPEKYMTVFADGVLMHHENMDGSGYPEGLSNGRIPYVARLIHVAESFNALISKRNYRSIFDKESALDELKKMPGLYDSEIVDVLEMLI